MARVLGIDLGSYSVKIAELLVGFRSVQLTSLRQLPVPPGPEAPHQRSLRALGALAGLEGDAGITVGYAGDQILFRRLEVPLSDPRKVRPIVANELADDLPWDPEGVTFDFCSLPGPRRFVLAAAARSEQVGGVLEDLAAMDLDPRHLAVAPVSYGELVRLLAGPALALVVDIGHLRTQLCLVQEGRPVATRTILAGGHRVTDLLRRRLQISYAEAEELKHVRVSVGVDLEEMSDEARQLGTIAQEGLSPLVRDLRHTVGVMTSYAGEQPTNVLLCGGGSLLRGIGAYLDVELGFASRRVTFAGVEGLDQAGLGEELETCGALALGLALDHGRRPPLDLRQGEYAYRVDRSVLRDKSRTLVLSAAAVLFFAALSTLASYSTLGHENEALREDLSKISRRILGTAVADPGVASRRVLRGARAAAIPIPESTAADILEKLSRGMPSREKVQIDVSSLDIKPDKTYLKGTADSRSAIDDVIDRLEGDPCFEKLSAGKIVTVSEGRQQFSLTISTSCY